MQLPALLPKSLEFAAQASDDAALFEALIKEPPQLIKFLVRACADETWAEQHAPFMTQALTWVNQQFYQDKLLMSFAQRVAKVIREHYAVMSGYLPKNLTLKLKERDLQMSSLLLGSSSEYLRELLRRECRDRRKTTLLLKEIPYSLFEVVEEFVTLGEYKELVRKGRKEVLQILRLAMLWQLDELSEGCQDTLKLYITRENVFETLLRSHNKQRLRLRQACFDFVNDLHSGYRFEDRGSESLAFEFLEFTENSLEAFHQVSKKITHLIIGGGLPAEEPFLRVLKECPKLFCLDLSRTNEFYDVFQELPKNLSELELSACLWLNNEALEKLIDLCPQLTRLKLQSDVKLDAGGWAHLKKLEILRSLDLTRCSQIGDADLALILQACPELIVLNLEDCRSLTDSGFNALPTYKSDLTSLSLARTWISDLPLIELATKSDLLTTLDITRCENLTAVGITEVARHCKNLRELNITSCDISPESIAEIRKMRPYLKLIN